MTEQQPQWTSTATTEEERAEAFRQFHAAQLQAQTDAAQRSLGNLRSIQTYVAVWFWLTIVGALLVVLMAAANS